MCDALRPCWSSNFCAAIAGTSARYGGSQATPAWSTISPSGSAPTERAYSALDNNERGGAVVHAGSVAGGDRAARVERLELGHRLERRIGPDRLVAVDARDGTSPVTYGE